MLLEQEMKTTLRILEIEETCTGCGGCVSVCAKNALSLKYNEEGFYYPLLDEEKCVDCKFCEKACHVLNNIVPEKPSRNYDAYMLKAKDKDIVRKSSSGGIFTLLADEIIRQNGVVYGARYNYEKERLEHASSDDCSLDDLRKSKYIESYSGDIFKDVRKQLIEGRKVLFCGTPCQIEGLHKYLEVKRVVTTNLLLVRFVCHGVPSNRFFTEYKHYEEAKADSKMVYFDFRPKTRGWRNSDWLMIFANGKKETGPYYYYYYYYYFQLCSLLRKSCYSCKRVFHDVADITIGDFWGIGKYMPDNKDQEGISMALVHSKKGFNALNQISDFEYVERIPVEATDYIFREMSERVFLLDKRCNIMTKVLKNGYMKVAQKTLRFPMLTWRLKNFVKKLLGRKI